MTRIRNTWIDSLATQVCQKLQPDTRTPNLLAPWVADDRLTHATMLGYIASRDIKGQSPQTISEHLRSTGVIGSAASAARVASGLVMPVLRQVRSHGMPWKHWWNIRELSVLLVELWAGRRMSTQPREKVCRELATLWGVTANHIDLVLANTADPYRHLPPDFLASSATGTAMTFLHMLVTRGQIKLLHHEEFVRSRDLSDRPDIAELVRRLSRRMELEHAVSRRIRNIPADVENSFRKDLDAWDAQMSHLASCLTAHELDLLRPVQDDEQYRDRCLTDGKGFRDARLLLDDALLWEPNRDAANAPVPEWIHDEVVTCGSRFFHTRVGPHPVWLATAESNTALAALKALLTPGGQYDLIIDDSAPTVVKLWLALPLPPGDPGPAFQAPYSYTLSWVEHAWELLHLATVGYTRLVVVQLVGDGELLPVGSSFLPLPLEACTKLQESAVTALRKLIGDETRSILWRAATEGSDQAAESAFQSCENAKGEDLHDELAPLAGFRASAEFMYATRRLAAARARHAAGILDGKDLPGTDIEIRSAAEDRYRTLELMRGQLDAGQRRATRPRPTLSTEQSAFVHLINRQGGLQLVAQWCHGARTRFELFPRIEFDLQALTDAVRDWTHRMRDHPELRWHNHLDQLLAACREVAQLVAETLERQGIRRLILSPTTPFELLPLHATPIDFRRSTLLIEAFEHVTYAPTLRLVSALKQVQRRPAATDALVVAHSGHGIPGLVPIGGPLAEARIVAALHDSTHALLEEAATPAHTLKSMSDARIIHVASHGLTHPNRWAAGLALHGSSLGQATLTASRILADGDFSSVDSVILNACRTGAHESTAQVVQTLRSVESAFLARGARTVISTLWEITSLQGMVFAAMLHSHLAGGTDPESAYRETVDYLRNRQWRTDTSQEPMHTAESLISRELPNWREHLDQQAADNPLFWAAFKIAGVV